MLNSPRFEFFFLVGCLCRFAPHASGVKVVASRQGRVGSWSGTTTKDSVQIVLNSMTWVSNNSSYI